MLKVGLTGGIACGKSTVARLMVDKGALLIDADQLAREVVKPGCPAWKEIVEWLGKEIITADGNLDRKRIAALVFSDEQARKRLNAIVHFRVMDLLHKKSLALACDYPQKIQIWDIPLLFEVQEEKSVDFILVVACSREKQMKRLIERDGLSRDEALKRINAQFALERKIERAHFVIYNDDTEEALKKQVELLWGKLQLIAR